MDREEKELFEELASTMEQIAHLIRLYVSHPEDMEARMDVRDILERMREAIKTSEGLIL